MVIARRFRPRPYRAVFDRRANRNSRFLAVNTQSNSANLGYNLITKYPLADYVCVDAPKLGSPSAIGCRMSAISLGGWLTSSSTARKL